MNATFIGLVAGALTSSAIVPQIVKCYRSKKVRDISIWQPVLLNAGMLLWLIYGIQIRDIPLVAANSFSIACNSLLILMKFRYGDDKKKTSDYILSNKDLTEEI